MIKKCYKTYKLQTIAKPFASKIIENQEEKQYKLDFKYLNLD